MSDSTSLVDQPIPSSIDNLAQVLEGKTHSLAIGDSSLAEIALQVVKDVFDLGLNLESLSHPHLHPLLAEILQPPTITLRSQTKSKSKSKSNPSPEPEAEETRAPESILPFTPLTELTVENMDAEQIWNQLELRNQGIGAVVKEVGAGNADDEDEDDKLGSDGEDEDDTGDEDENGDGSDEEMTEEEFRRMFAEAEGIDSGSSEEEDEEDEDENESEDGGFRLREEMSDTEDDDDEVDDDEEEDDDDEDEDDGMENLDDEEDDEDFAEMDDEDQDENDEEEDDDLDLESNGRTDADLEEEASDSETDITELSKPGPSVPKLKTRTKAKSHPTLDDTFFSIDEFNKLTEMAEASRVSSGRLGRSASSRDGQGGEEEDEEEQEEEEEGLGDMGDLMLREVDDDATVMYSDFFDPPKKEYIPSAQYKTQSNEAKNGKKADKKGKGKAKALGGKVRFGDDEILNENEDEGAGDQDEDEIDEDGAGVMGRVKGDLFDDDDDDDEEVSKQQLSTHEKTQQALRRQIAELEQQVIGPKDWTLMGEASAKSRPENSLLEEDLDFEQVGKVVPVVTEESVKTLEDMIKIRIRDNNFNSPIRVQAYDPTPFLPSRFFELSDKQSTKSLAQIYEDDYQAASSGSKVVDARDLKLKNDHEEIEKLWGEICYKLDALSSLNFVPKQPKAQITTVTNLPTTTLESALPPTSNPSTLLAPEELFAPPTASALTSRTEQTPEENQRQRLKIRKAKKANKDKLGSMVELYGGGKNGGGRKGEKERALQSLVKTGKGVTVVGKGGGGGGGSGGKSSGGTKGVNTTTSNGSGNGNGNKERKRSRPDPDVREDGKRLKL